MSEPFAMTETPAHELVLMAYTALIAAGFAATRKQELRRFPERTRKPYTTATLRAVDGVIRYARKLGVCQEDLDSALTRTIIAFANSAQPGEEVSAN
ncbi:hypothetical protein [Nocardia brasiliensis]|uniref:hypothetical protein n=1 Tax=Nocardia brasiliensis TaxID=37326 RepID=UPI0024551F54|nr:hypothetical protein [Nocardia brasiliensis]